MHTYIIMVTNTAGKISKYVHMNKTSHFNFSTYNFELGDPSSVFDQTTTEGLKIFQLLLCININKWQDFCISDDDVEL